MTARNKPDAPVTDSGFSREVDALIEANVATWPALTPERMTEFMRITRPVADRIRARVEAETNTDRRAS